MHRVGAELMYADRRTAKRHFPPLTNAPNNAYDWKLSKEEQCHSMPY